jgi:hypothetical protein
MKEAMNITTIPNPPGMATSTGAFPGIQLASLPVEVLDLILDHNLGSLADFQATRQISRAFNRIVIRTEEFKRWLGKVHIMLDSDMTKKAVRLRRGSVWREITHTVVLEIPRARPFYAAARPHWHNPLEDAPDTAITDPDMLRCTLEFTTSLQNLQRCTLIHNVPVRATQARSRTQKHRNRSKKEFMDVFNGVIPANVEVGVVGHPIGTAGKPETRDVEDHFVFRK